MSAKEALRGVLPPTNRNFEDRIDSLERKLDAALQDNRELRATLDDLRRDLADLCKRSRYANVEYLPLQYANGSKVLVAGWYGADNFGDELMLRTVLQFVPEQCMDNVYVLLWDNEGYDRTTLDLRCHVVHYPNSTWDIERLADSFDAVVWGGGAIIDDGQYDADPRNFNTGNLFIRLNEQMLARGKRVYALGLSTNYTLESEAYAEKLSRIIEAAECFSLRDPYSLKTLERAGVSCSGKVALCEDLAFFNSALWSLAACREEDERPLIGVVLLCVEDSFEDNLRLLALLAKSERVRRSGCRISLIPFLNEGAFADAAYFQRLLERLGEDCSMAIEPFATSLEDLAIRRCSVLISSKYHATLIADVLGIPNICLCDEGHPHYRNKMLHLAEFAGVPQTLFSLSELLDESAFDRAVERLLDGSLRPSIDRGRFASQAEWVEREILRALQAAS